MALPTRDDIMKKLAEQQQLYDKQQLYDFQQRFKYSDMQQAVFPTPSTPKEDISAKKNMCAQAMLLSRLRQWSDDSWLKGNNFLFCYVNEEKDVVNVFFVFSGISDVLEDDIHLFPSDALVSQLRLLRG